MARHGSCADGESPSPAARLVVGKRDYHTVVLPPLTETLRSETVKLLEEFAAAGGQVVCLRSAAGTGRRPAVRSRREAGPEPRLEAGRCRPRATALVAPSLDRDTCVIQRAAGDKGILFHQRRQLADGQLLLLVNTSIERRHRGTVESTTGQGRRAVGSVHGRDRSRIRSADRRRAIRSTFDLPPCGSLLLFLAKQPGPPVKAGSRERAQVHRRAGTAQIRRIAAERADPRLHGHDRRRRDARRTSTTTRANQLAWQKNGMPRNPWDSAVQYKEELISRKFPADSGFEATYRFTIEGRVPKPSVHRHRAAGLVYDHLQWHAGHGGQGCLVARQGLWQDRHHGRRQAGRKRGDAQGPTFHDVSRDCRRPSCWASSRCAPHLPAS